jgi:hypothetical protein
MCALLLKKMMRKCSEAASTPFVCQILSREALGNVSLHTTRRDEYDKQFESYSQTKQLVINVLTEGNKLTAALLNAMRI